jgi:hypothetical protein
MASQHHDAAKAAKQAAYETACRTPGTPEHAARQARLDQRTRELEREQTNQRRALRRAVAATSLDQQRRVIDAVMAARAKTRA